jgi:hypothetical protein
MSSKRKSGDEEQGQCFDSQESLGEAFSNVSLERTGNKIGCLMFIFTNKYNRRFVPFNMTFAYDPKNDLHLSKKATKLQEVKEKAQELRVSYHVVDMMGDTEFDVIQEIGGIDLKSAKFPPAPKSNWLKVSVRRAAKKIKIGTQAARVTTRSNSGSSSK